MTEQILCKQMFNANNSLFRQRVGMDKLSMWRKEMGN